MTLTDCLIDTLSDYDFLTDDIEKIAIGGWGNVDTPAFFERGKNVKTNDVNFQYNIVIFLKGGMILSFYPARIEIHDGNTCLFTGGFDLIDSSKDMVDEIPF